MALNITKQRVHEAIKLIERRKQDFNLSEQAVYTFYCITATLSDLSAIFPNFDTDTIKALCEELVIDGFLEVHHWEDMEKTSFSSKQY